MTTWEGDDNEEDARDYDEDPSRFDRDAGSEGTYYPELAKLARSTPVRSSVPRRSSPVHGFRHHYDPYNHYIGALARHNPNAYYDSPQYYDYGNVPRDPLWEYPRCYCMMSTYSRAILSPLSGDEMESIKDPMMTFSPILDHQ